MSNSIPVWSGEWLAHLLNPFVGQFNGVGTSGQWIELDIRELLLSRKLNSEESPLSNENSFALSQLSSNFSIPSRSYSDRNVDLLTGQSDFGGFLATAGLRSLDNNILNGNEQFTPENKIGRIDVHELIDDSHIVATEFNTYQKVDLQDINPGNDARHLIPDKAQTDDAAPTLTLALQTDTGWDATDGITQTPVLVGTVSSQNEVARVSASAGEAILDITNQVQPDGSFTLDESLLRLLIGGPLVDDTYNVSVTAEDRLGNASAPVEVSMTLDRTAAELLLKSPLVNGTHSDMVHLLGSADEAGILSTTLNDGIAVDMEVRDILDQSLQSLPLEDGAHQLTVHFSDIAGNVTEQVINFEVDGSAFVIGSTDTISWATTTDDEILLAEGNSFITQAQMPISLSQSEGSRTLRFAVDADFDTTDETATSGDTLAVYLISTDDPSQTLLENGTPGTPVFSLTADTADFMPGLVTYDGQFVEIDLTSLNAETEGTLIFQLLNQDGDTSSRIHISQLTNTLDPKGSEALRFEETDTVVKLGGELALENLSVSKTIEPVLSQTRFNAETGEYTAHLQLRNTGETSISRQAAVVFDALPDGVSLTTLSGNDGEGNPYVNLYHTIRPGGLGAGELSDAISITVSNLEQLQLILMPQVLVGGPNQAPVLDPIDPVEVMPGQRVEILLNAVDPNGDRVTYSLRTDTDLPNGRLDGTGILSFEPTPNDIGTYSFTVIASDGAESVEQTVTLNVVPDPITTTRISGRVLDTNGAPLVNLPIELGRLQTLTDSDGNFILTIPDTSFPTDELDITVPFGDQAFDPFFTGTQVIDLRRTTFDGTTGTDISNPLRHPNLVSAYINASMVYGNDTSTANALRTLDGTGQLKVLENNLLPLNNTEFFPDGPLPNSNRSLNDPGALFATGDVRANENIGLTAMHTVFVREHNRLASKIQSANPELSGDEIYNHARKQVAAQIQHITYSEYLPLLIGSDALDTYTGYDETADPAISHLFSAASFRMGHTQSFSEFLLIDDNGEALPSVSLRESTFNPEIIHQYGIDAILRGLYAQLAEAIDTKVIDELRNTLFGPPGAGGIDLAAVDIERGRDVGLPDYNQARIDMGLAPVTSFAEITSDLSVQAILEQLYDTVNDIDVIVGGLAEDHVPGAMVGELFQIVIADQFTRLRDGDRFWHENGQFTQAELDNIRGTTLARLIQRNTDITSLPDYVFSNQGVPTAPEAAGTVASETLTEYGAIDGSGHGQPGQGLPGDLMGVNYTQEYGDGIRSVAGETRPNTREISNALFAQTESIPDAQGGTGFMLAWSQFMGHDLSFSPAGAADTLKFYGTEHESLTGEEFPYVAEKIDLVLGHGLYAGVNNVIERPIYLPALDIVNNEQTTDSQGNITVNNESLGAEVFVAADALSDREGNPFEGQLTISEVPPDLTPAVLPEGLSPDLVVTIQPGEMAFDTPALLTLPNIAEWEAGMVMDLWSINPTTGDFEIVGTGRVSADGQSIETIEGGIRNSSWHFFSNTPIDWTLNVLHPQCVACTEKKDFSSDVELYTGTIVETHTLTTYQSLGKTRGVQLVYDSLRADARPIVQIGFAQVDFRTIGIRDQLRLTAELSLTVDGVERRLPGYSGTDILGAEGKHFWQIPDGIKPPNTGLQADLRDVDSGVYNLDVRAGLQRLVNRRVDSETIQRLIGTTTESSDGPQQLVHVNTVNSAFGSGWGIAGVQEIKEGDDGSLLLIDGDGTEVLFDVPEMAGGSYVAPLGDFSVLERLADGTFRRTTKDQTVYQFDETNRLVSITDRNGNETRHVYDESGHLTAIVDPTGLATSFTYNAQGNVSQITDPANRVTELVYDTAGNLLQIVDPDASQRTFNYDADHHMTGEIDKRGHQERAYYDEFGRASRAERKDGSVVEVQAIQTISLYRPEQTADWFNAPVASQQTTDSATYTDGNGHSTQSTLDAAGQLIESSDAVGAVTGEIVRNEDNLVVEYQDTAGNVTTYDYDGRGNLIRVADALSGNGRSESQSIELEVDALNTADINNDGFDDLLVISDEDYFGDDVATLSVYLSNGDRSFADPLEYEIPRASRDIVAADINQDGLTDLFVTNRSRGLTTLLNRDNGVFIPSLRSDIRYGDVKVLDVDFDGQLDLLNGAYWYRGFGNGAFSLDRQYLGNILNQGIPAGENSAIGDLDGDGDTDVADIGSDADGLTLQIFTNTGNGEFWTSPDEVIHIAAQNYESVAITQYDLDGDADLDLVVAGNTDTIQVFLNNGNAVFTPASENTDYLTFDDRDGDGDADINAAITDEQLFTAYGLIYRAVNEGELNTSVRGKSSALGDLDGDGDIDILDEGSGNLAIIFNEDNGRWWSLETEIEALNIENVQLADVNNDGNLDIVGIAYEYNDAIAVSLNDGQGGFTSRQVYSVNNGDYTNEFHLADIDRDGNTDVLLVQEEHLIALLGDGAGAFNEQRDITIDRNFRSIALGQFDSNGILDWAGIPEYSYSEPNETVQGYDISTFNLSPETTLETTLDAVFTGRGERTYDYDSIFNQVVFFHDEVGNQTVYELDAHGNRSAEISIVGERDSATNGETDDVVTRYTYTQQGLLDMLTDTLGRTTDYDYDAFGRLTQTIFAVGTNDEARQQFDYDVAGNLTAFIDENGNRTEYVYDALNRIVQITEAAPDGAGPLKSPVTGFTYDATGNLSQTTDARGNETQYVYDERDRLTQLTDVEGNVTQYAYDNSDNLVSMVDARGEETQFEYDNRNRQTAVIDVAGHTTHFRYDLDNNLTDVIDPLNNRTSYVYDARDRLVSEVDAFGNATTYTYDGANNLIWQTDRNNRSTHYAYDALNRLTQVTDALDGTTVYGYDALGNLLGETDERQNTTGYQYDARNRLLQVTNALGGTLGYTYDGVGNVLSETDELGRITAYTYDGLNRLTQVSDPLNHATTFGYDAVGNLTALTDALGRVTTYSYDGLNRQVTRGNALGDASTTTYDAVGNVIATTDELGRTTTYGYDARNLLIQVSDPLGHAVTRAYDAVGNLTTLTDALNNTTTYDYDALYRRTKVADATGAQTQMTYDAVGNLTTLRDAVGNTTSYGYDALYRLTIETDAVGAQTLMTYDAVGNLVIRVDRNGRGTNFAYDALNRPTQEQWLDDTNTPLRSIDYTYDAASQLITVSDPDSVYGYTYDAAGRVTSVTNDGTPDVPEVTLTYGYDAVNNLTSVKDSINGAQTGTETFTYDVLDRLTRITQGGNGVAQKRVDMTYDAVSQMTGSNRYSDLPGTRAVAETVYAYDAAGRLTDLTHQRDNAIIAEYSLSYDAANRLTQLVAPDGTSDYGYNSRDELTSTDHSHQKDESYDYDATGNRMSHSIENLNRILDDGTYTYEYDNEGNRTRRVEIETGEITHYTWDHWNRLMAVVMITSDGTVLKKAKYIYDAYNRRIAKVVNADGESAITPTEERFVYDGDHIALVFDGDGNQTHRYLHGPKIDQVLAEETADGRTRWALTDHQGSVRDVIDNQGTVLNHITYDSFGQVTNQSNPTAYFRFGYTGRELDQESGQYFYRARYYDPSVGRFISEDPIGFDAGDTNLYRYVSNSSPNYVDPTGNYIESGWDLLSLGVGVASLGVNIRRRDWKNAAIDGVGITADVGALLLPVPGGVSAARNAEKVGKVATFVNRSQSLKRGTDFVKFHQGARNSIRVAQLTNLGTSIYQTGESGVQTYRDWRDSCSGEIPWRALIQTGLSGLGILGTRNNVRRSFQRESVIANKIGTSKRLINSYDEFHKKYHQDFKKHPNNTIIAWEWYQESATSSRTSVIGRLPDIAKAAPEQTFHRLNIGQRQGWKPEVNDAWLQGVIDAGRPLKLASPIKKSTLKRPPGSEYKYTVYRRELQQLKKAGYTTRNGWAIPPKTTSP